MGANTFKTFPTIPTGSAPGVTTPIVANDLEKDKTFLMTGEFTGTIAIEGTTDDVNFSVIGQFESGEQRNTQDRVFEPLAPIMADSVVKSMRLRVVTPTTIHDDVIITVGAEANCDCISGSTSFGSIVAVDADPNDDGVSTDAARADHKHQVDTGTPGSTELGDTAADGVSLDLARADHQHGFPFGGTPAPISNIPAIGTSTAAAASDHTHVGVGDVDGITGSVAINSPMKTVLGSDIDIDHLNVKTLADAATIIGIDTDVNNGFKVILGGNRTMGIPTNTKDGRVIVFAIGQDGSGGRTLAWTLGAGGYLFSTLGQPTQAEVDAALALTPANGFLNVGFHYNSTLDRWVCVALAGPWS